MYDYKNKKLNLRREFDFLLSKTLSMFRYEGLPETMPHRDFERQLQTKGYAFITEFKGELYSFTDGLGGEPDAYGNPTEIVIANPALGFNKTLNLKDDGVLIRNDSMMNGIRNLLKKYVFMMNENEITMIMNSYNSRIPTLISAGDDATRESAEQYLHQVIKGEIGIIAENRLFEGINAQATGAGAGAYTQLIEYQQYLKATLYNELGLEMNNNMKRERLTEDEVNMVDTIYPFVDNMMMNRDEGIKEVNKMFDKNIKIEFDSIWAQHNEQSDEEFLADVEMYMQQMQPQQEEPDDLSMLFGDTSDEELEQVLAQLIELDEEGEDIDGDNSGGSDDSSTDSATGGGSSSGKQSESGESSKDTESSGTVGTDNARPDADEPGDADEPDTGRGDETDSDDSDESSGTVESDVGEPDADNAGTDNESDRRSEGANTERTESSTEESGEESSGEDAVSSTSSSDGDTDSSGSVSSVEVSTGSDSDESSSAGTGPEEGGEGSSIQPETGGSEVNIDIEINIEEGEDEEDDSK